MYILQVTDLSKSYDHRTFAVKELSFAVETGHILALLGHNGAGKTTTLRILSTTLEPTSGKVEIDGVDLSETNVDRLRQIKRNIGFVPETANLLGYLTPWEFLYYIGQMYGIDDENFLRKRIDELIEKFSITEATGKYVENYSSGLKKRISIAAMMINSPRVLLLDEPTANLDHKTAYMVINIMKKMKDELGTTFVFSTHDQKIVSEAEIVYTLEDGELTGREVRKSHV